MSYSKDPDFSSVPLRDRRLLLATHLDAAIGSNDLDTINKIIKLNHYSWLYKIIDEKMMQKMIEKWKTCAMVDNSIIYSIWGLFECVSASVPIIRICLDYLVDPDVQLSPYDVTLGRFGCYTPGYDHDALHDEQEREYSLWVGEHKRYSDDSRPTTDTKRAKHDELMKIYLEYYPSLKKKCSYKALSDAYDVQSKYIISRITQMPEERVPTLKLIIDTFGHANQPYLADLFMKSCAANNIPVIVCMLRLNPAFCANIQNGIVVDYGIQNEDTTHIKNKLNQTLEAFNTTIAVLNNIDANFSNIKSQLDSTIEQTNIKFVNIKLQLDNVIEQIRVRTTYNGATVNESGAEIIKKPGYDRTETMAELKANHAEIIKKLRDDHAEIIKKPIDDRAEIIKKPIDDRAEIIKKPGYDLTETMAELKASHVRSTEIMKKIRDDHAELKAGHVRSAEIMKKMRDDHAEIIKKLEDDHAETLAELNVHYAEIVKKTKDDHAEIMKKTKNYHTELIATKLQQMQSQPTYFLTNPTYFLSNRAIMKKMEADQREIMEKLRIDHAETMTELIAARVRNIERVTKGHTIEITKLRADHAIEIIKLRAQYQL